MLTEQITSRQNPLVKRAQRVRAGQETGRLFVDGARLVEEAIVSGVALEALIYTTSFAESERGSALLDMVATTHCRGAHVPETVMKAVCDVETPQGIVALVAQPQFALSDVLGEPSPLIVVLDGLQDPGNVGSIVRAAEGAGASGVLTTLGTAEPYSPKAIRASMGSAFRLPIVRRVRLRPIAQRAKALGIQIYSSGAGDGVPYTEVNWRLPSLVVIGNEGAGVSDVASTMAAATVSIPMVEPVESLNAAVATGIMLFEAARQRSSVE